MGNVSPNSVNHGSDGTRDRDLMGNWDESLPSPVAIPSAMKTNRSLFLLCKCIRSFPLSLQRNTKNHTEQNRRETSILQEKELMDEASRESRTPRRGHRAPGEARRETAAEIRGVLTTALGARSVWRKGTWRVKSIARKAEWPFSCFCRACDPPRTPAPQSTGPAAGQNLAAAVTAPWVCLLVSVAHVSNGKAAMPESCRTCGHLMTRQ